MIHEIRLALRLLVKNPLFALVGILTLALGIGATTAVFTLVNALLIKPLPYKDPAQTRLCSSSIFAISISMRSRSRRRNFSNTRRTSRASTSSPPSTPRPTISPRAKCPSAFSARRCPPIFSHC